MQVLSVPSPRPPAAIVDAASTAATRRRRSSRHTVTLGWPSPPVSAAPAGRGASASTGRGGLARGLGGLARAWGGSALGGGGSAATESREPAGGWGGLATEGGGSPGSARDTSSAPIPSAPPSAARAHRQPATAITAAASSGTIAVPMLPPAVCQLSAVARRFGKRCDR